jgi:hypothetical protein
LAEIGVIGFEAFSAGGESANRTEKSVGTRREWRIKQETGELRGVSIRERNKQRKSVGWIDRESAGWNEIVASYEGWRRTARYAVGTFEQRPIVTGGQPTGENSGKSPN